MFTIKPLPPPAPPPEGPKSNGCLLLVLVSLVLLLIGWSMCSGSLGGFH